MSNIFGYTFDEIKAAQQGQRLGRAIDATKPPQCAIAGRVNSEYHQTPCYKLNKPQVLGTCLV